MAVQDLTSRDVRGMIYYQIGNPDTFAQAESWISKIATPPQRAENGQIKVSAIGGHPSFGELRLPRKTNDALTLGQTVVTEEYDSGMRIRERELRRDQTGLLRTWINQRITTPVQRRWVKILTKVIENSETLKSPDNVAMFSDAHTYGRNTTAQDNLLAKVPADTSGLIPTVAEVEDYVWDAVGALQGYKDNENEPLNFSSNFVVMYHPKLQRQMKTAFGSPFIDAGSVIRPNTLEQSISQFGFTLVANQYLTTHVGIYVFADDGLAFIRASEYDPIVETIAEGSEFQIRNLAHEYFVRFSAGAMPYRWESAVKIKLVAS